RSGSDRDESVLAQFQLRPCARPGPHAERTRRARTRARRRRRDRAGHRQAREEGRHRIADRRSCRPCARRQLAARRRGVTVDEPAAETRIGETMLFVITAIDKEGSLQLRMATREAHMAYVKE